MEYCLVSWGRPANFENKLKGHEDNFGKDRKNSRTHKSDRVSNFFLTFLKSDIMFAIFQAEF